MKQIKNLFKRAALAVVMVAGVLLLTTFKASALGPESIAPLYSVYSFYTTNSLISSNLYNGYPTNALYTAWANSAQGQGVFIGGQDKVVTLIMQGYLTNAATNTINISFVTSGLQNGSASLTGNPAYLGGPTNANDWTFNSNTVSINLPSFTGFYHYETNLALNSTTFPNSEWIGISSISWNVATATTFGTINTTTNAPGLTNGLGLFFLGVKTSPTHLQ